MTASDVHDVYVTTNGVKVRLDPHDVLPSTEENAPLLVVRRVPTQPVYAQTGALQFRKKARDFHAYIGWCWEKNGRVQRLQAPVHRACAMLAPRFIQELANLTRKARSDHRSDHEEEPQARNRLCAGALGHHR